MRRTKKLYKFAGIKVKIKYFRREVGEYFKKYETDGKAEFTVCAREHDLAFERCLAEQAGEHFTDWQYEELAIQREFSAKAVKFEVLLFHSSVVMVEGEAYVFAAPSGTGKSTHARLWRKVFGEKVTVINDDKPFFRKEGEVWYAYGSPWNGKHRLDNNIKAPIKAICFLEQSAENEIHRIGTEEGFPRLCKQAYFPAKRSLCEQAIKLAGELARLPMYLMRCNISGEAAQMSYHAMRGESIE